MAESRAQRRAVGSTAPQTGIVQQREQGRQMGRYGGDRGAELVSPFAFMQRLMSDMDSLFGDFGFRGSALSSREGTGGANVWMPQIDVTTRDGQLLVHADLPGLKQEDVKVTVHDGVLRIAGERSDRHEEERGGVFRRERSYGSFSRQIALPEGVDPDEIKASFENGVLEVIMPLPQQTAPQGRTIPVTSKPSGGPPSGGPDVH